MHNRKFITLESSLGGNKSDLLDEITTNLDGLIQRTSGRDRPVNSAAKDLRKKIEIYEHLGKEELFTEIKDGQYKLVKNIEDIIAKAELITPLKDTEFRNNNEETEKANLKNEYEQDAPHEDVFKGTPIFKKIIDNDNKEIFVEIGQLEDLSKKAFLDATDAFDSNINNSLERSTKSNLQITKALKGIFQFKGIDTIKFTESIEDDLKKSISGRLN